MEAGGFDFLGPEAVGIWLEAMRAGAVDPNQWNLLVLGSKLCSKAREAMSIPWLAIRATLP
jgi:hypothetical protein